MSQLSFQRNIPIRYEVDVFVAGGGPAGVAAAVTASREGAKVFLAEAQSCLGGMGTSGMVPVFMQFSDGINFLAAGIGEEIFTRLRDGGGTGPDDELAIKTEVLKRVYDQIVIDAGVNLSFQTQLIAVEAEGGNVLFAICSAKSGIFAVKAKIFIDCTGDGDLAAWAGAEHKKGDDNGRLMPGTLCSLWTRLNWDKIPPYHQRNHLKNLEKAFKEKVFTVEDRHLSGIIRVGNSTGGGNVGHTFGVDGTDERTVTKALVWARKSLAEYQTYYRKFIPGFENMELAATGSLLGIRETRRITGDYVLSLEDFKAQAVFGDEIGRYCYGVDIHPSTSDEENFQKFQKETTSYRYSEGQSYGIPYRILRPHKLRNVLVAGRCVSTDRYMQSSIRTMPGCYITGQAAGMAAVLTVQTPQAGDVRSISVTQLQQKLRSIGAYLPNAG